MTKDELIVQNRQLKASREELDFICHNQQEELDFLKNLLKEIYGFHWAGVDPETRAFVRQQVKQALKEDCNICAGFGKLPSLKGKSMTKCSYCHNVG